MGEYVNQRSLALAGVVLVSVVAIALSAATVANVEGAAGEGSSGLDLPAPQPGGSVENGSQQPGGQGNFREANGTSNRQQFNWIRGCNDLLNSLPGSLAYFAALVGIIYLLKRRFSLGFTLLGAYAVTPIFLTVYFLRTQCGGSAGDMASNTLPGNGSGPDPGVGPSVSPVVLIAGFAVLFVGVAAVLYMSTGSREYLEEDERDEEEQADVEDIAAAAAEARERLESRDADVDNEVYRAWWEMTQLLNVSSPETYTPGEFAEAAIEVGIDREHVEALTTLFEEVRYGHRDPESREERAIEVFRRIEEYGEDGADAGSDGVATDGTTGNATGGDAGDAEGPGDDDASDEDGWTNLDDDSEDEP